MPYPTLEHCLLDLEKNGQLIRVKECVDPYLEMAHIHLRVNQAKGPALLFENVKGTRFRAASNIFGTTDRTEFIFRHTLQAVQQLIEFKNNPSTIFKNKNAFLSIMNAAWNSRPLKITSTTSLLKAGYTITDLPLIHHWPNDGGPFITLPQVYTEDPHRPSIKHSNIGMYRIQLLGNDYLTNQEVGLHYQLHRGIGIHQTAANSRNEPLKLSCFVGGPPAHSLAAIMPLPEGLSEVRFAGALAGKRFKYFYDHQKLISADADFVITGEVIPHYNKREGPFGDHLGYYSLQHPFPVLKIHKVLAKPNAIWPFTIVGRPPQEDSSFGAIIHKITGNVITKEIPGLKELNAVDAAGVHPLLLAIGSERYTPYLENQPPAELLTIANRILGTGQLSLAKYLFITAPIHNQKISTHSIETFFLHIFQTIDFTRDIHFYTHTSIDTLDYSGTALHAGSKVVIATYGEPKRNLTTQIPNSLSSIAPFHNPQIVFPGVIALAAPPFVSYQQTHTEQQQLNHYLIQQQLPGIALIVLCDDSRFVSQHINNFLWTTFTRSNPAADIYGIGETLQNKHWGCLGPLIIDARIKPHHAPILQTNSLIEEKIQPLFKPKGSLYGYGL